MVGSMSDCIEYKVLSVIKKINWLCEGKDINEYSSVMVDLKDVKYLMEYIEMLEHKLENKEDKEIDIQSIEELSIRPFRGYTNICEYIEEKGNEIIKALKQLDKKIK